MDSKLDPRLIHQIEDMETEDSIVFSDEQIEKAIEANNHIQTVMAQATLTARARLQADASVRNYRIDAEPGEYYLTSANDEGEIDLNAEVIALREKVVEQAENDTVNLNKLKRLIKNLENAERHRPNMEALVWVGIIASVLGSVAGLFGGKMFL